MSLGQNPLEAEEPKEKEALVQPEFDKDDLEAEIQELRAENLYLSQEFIKKQTNFKSLLEK